MFTQGNSEKSLKFICRFQAWNLEPFSVVVPPQCSVQQLRLCISMQVGADKADDLLKTKN